jgi:ABC-2 type transport system permease protein
VAVLANPLVYISEGMRATLTTGISHMNLGFTLAAMSAFTLVHGTLGLRGFRRRVTD